MLNVHRTDANICNSKISQTNGLESCGKNAAEKKCLCVFLTLVILKLYIFVGSTCRRSYLQVTTFGRSYAMQFHVSQAPFLTKTRHSGAHDEVTVDGSVQFSFCTGAELD
jgi:hypothetical protein